MESLVDIQLITNEVRLKNNYLSEGRFDLSPTIVRKISSIDENKHSVELSIEMKDKPEARFPIDLYISITGIFDLTKLPSEQKDDFLKYQSVQILMPYLRGMVTSTTANSLLPPIIIPIIDVKQIFPEEVLSSENTPK